MKKGAYKAMTSIAVIGSRNPTKSSIKAVRLWLDKYMELNGDSPVTIVTGGAFGMDTEAMKYAVTRKLKLKVFRPANYHNSRLCDDLKNNPLCDIIQTEVGYLQRNTMVIESSDVVVSSDYGNGTIDSMEKALARGLKVYVIGEYISSAKFKRALPASNITIIDKNKVLEGDFSSVPKAE
ncbi:DNA-processing protein DprA [Succinivibrio dextrinosolvens]|nr:DNA-processing protein DprA [Succinivibrio dextrinosolvens]